MKKSFLTIVSTALITTASFLVACQHDKDSTVQLPADAQCNCSGSYYRYVGGGDTVFIPNAFSPNGDGLNDLIHVLTNQTLSNYSLTIYQGAQLLFSSTNQIIRWDGSTGSTGNTLPAGDCVARIKFTNGAGQQVNDCVCIHLLAPKSGQACIDARGINPNTLTFEDQVDPSTGMTIYNTGEVICP